MLPGEAGDPSKLTTEGRGSVPSVDTLRELVIRMLRVAVFRLKGSLVLVCCGRRAVLVLRIDLLRTDCRLLSRVPEFDRLRCGCKTSPPLDTLRIGTRPGATGATRDGRRTDDLATVVLRGNELMEPLDGGLSPGFGLGSELTLRCSGDMGLFFFNFPLTRMLLRASWFGLPRPPFGSFSPVDNELVGTADPLRMLFRASVTLMDGTSTVLCERPLGASDFTFLRDGPLGGSPVGGKFGFSDESFEVATLFTVTVGTEFLLFDNADAAPSPLDDTAGTEAFGFRKLPLPLC